MADSEEEQGVFEKVREIVAEQLGIKEEEVNEKITRETKFVADLKADSLDLVELIMMLEEKFGGVISDEDAEKLETVGDAVDWILEHPKKD